MVTGGTPTGEGLAQPRQGEGRGTRLAWLSSQEPMSVGSPSAQVSGVKAIGEGCFFFLTAEHDFYSNPSNFIIFDVI